LKIAYPPRNVITPHAPESSTGTMNDFIAAFISVSYVHKIQRERR
jgi:hypothetical protein